MYDAHKTRRSLRAPLFLPFPSIRDGRPILACTRSVGAYAADYVLVVYNSSCLAILREFLVHAAVHPSYYSTRRLEQPHHLRRPSMYLRGMDLSPLVGTIMLGSTPWRSCWVFVFVVPLYIIVGILRGVSLPAGGAGGWASRRWPSEPGAGAGCAAGTPDEATGEPAGWRGGLRATGTTTAAAAAGRYNHIRPPLKC